jgi:hypothetical protein
LVVSEARIEVPAEDQPQAGTTRASESSEPDQRTTEPAPASGPVIAYYFHGTMRCPTCLKIERLARESIDTVFTRDKVAGLLEWRSVNYDEEANEHFVSDYALSASALVLVRPAAKPPSWQKLDRAWELVDDEPAFRAYVAEAVAGILGDRP